MRRKIEDHIGVERSETTEGLTEPPGDLRSAPVLVIPVHLFEQAVVKTLNAYGEPVDTCPLEDRQSIFGQVVRIGFDRQLPDVKSGICQCDRLFQLVDQDRRGSASYIDRPEVISEFTVEGDFLAERPKIGAAECLP